MTRAEAKQLIDRGKAIIGTMFLELASPGTCRMIKQAGYDFVIFDTEHSWYGAETIARFIRSARDIGLLVIIRAPASRGQWLARYLDMGADGLVCPHVDTAKQAEGIIRQTKYPPMGERGMAAGIAHDDYDAGAMAQSCATANDELLVIVQIETAAGHRARDEILSVEGIDVVFIGPSDLSLSLGLPGDYEHPTVVGAMEEIFEAAREHDVAAGLHGFSVRATLDWLDKGAQFLCHRADISFIIDSSRQDLARIREHSAFA